MAEMFEYRGLYRVQSRRTSVPSALAGEWFEDRPGLLDPVQANTALAAHPYWQGVARVNLRPALVHRRSGQFLSQRDILYKRAFFVPDPGTPGMPVDVVDVRKSEELWVRRRSHLQALFGQETAAAIEGLLPDLDCVIANEYVLHEAGHFLGYDVLRKYDDGYFVVAGLTAWPLIYLEELRADLQAFGFALTLLPAGQAAQVFLYNLSLRLGVHLAGVQEDEVAPYGTIPYLLFHLLRALGFLRVAGTSGSRHLAVESLHAASLGSVMEQCAAHALTFLTLPEVSAESRLDAAIAGAQYVRKRMDDAACAADFQAVMESCRRN